MKSSTAKPDSRCGRPASLRRRLLPVLIAACFGQAMANPQGAQVVSGTVGFNQQGGTLAVTNTPGAIINWQSFSINAGETTRFIQQGANSTVLNRVTGQDPSAILGALQSNGKVFLVNPNGILFGEGAKVDVNGLIASTLSISNEDFLNGRMNFAAAGVAGNIINQGVITTPAGGRVYLIARNIENSGIIRSPQGEVLLAAGHTVQLADSADPNLQVVLSASESEALNIGQILTEGGKTGIYGALIRQRGMISADSAVVGENGRIVFKSSKATLLEVGSVTSATGGNIDLEGEGIHVAAGAMIDSGSGYLGIYASNDVNNEGTLKADSLSIYASNDVNNKGTLKAGSLGIYAGNNILLGGGIETKGEVDSVFLSAAGGVDLKADSLATGDLLVAAGNGIRLGKRLTGIRNSTALYTAGDISQDAGATIAVPSLMLAARSATLLEENETGVISAYVQNDFAYRSRNQITLSGFGIQRGAWPDWEDSERLPEHTVGLTPHTASPAAGTVYLQSDLGIDQAAGAAIATNGATLALNTSGKVQLTDAGNHIDRIAARANGGLDVFSAADMEVGAWTSTLSGIPNSIVGIGSGGDVRLQTGSDAQLSIMQRVDAGAGAADLIADRLALHADVLASEASIRPYTNGRAITVGSADCAAEPCLAVSNLFRVAAATIGIGRDAEDSDNGAYAGAIDVAGITNTGTNAASDRNSVTTRIGLLSSGRVSQRGAIEVRELGVLAGGDVVLENDGNKVSTIVGRSSEGSFSFVNKGVLAIGSFIGPDYAHSGISAGKGSISVSNTGHLIVDAGATVGTEDGAITLVAHSPLTINGTVNSGSGAISLEAAQSGSPSDVLTVNGSVKSGGAVLLTAGAGIVINGSVDGASVTHAAPYVLTGQTTQAVAQTINTVVSATTQAANAIVLAAADSAPLDDEDERMKEKTGATSKDDGVMKNETGKKLYCN